MAKLYYKFGTMGSSKTAQALMQAYSNETSGNKPLLCKPCLDTRTKKIWSRIGLEKECISVEELMQLPPMDLLTYSLIIVDEAQFLTVEQVEFLAKVVDVAEISVYCYGLKTDYTGELFVGSKRLFELADEIEEIKTNCWCGEDAKFNTLIKDGKVYKERADSNIVLGTCYVALCRKHYNKGEFNQEAYNQESIDAFNDSKKQN